MFVLWEDLNRKHEAMVMCAKWAEWTIKRIREEEDQENIMVAFQAYGIPLELVNTFKYIGRIFATYHENWPEVDTNIWKSKFKCK